MSLPVSIKYYLAVDAVVTVDVFSKKTATTPGSVITDCKRQLRGFRRLTLSTGDGPFPP